MNQTSLVSNEWGFSNPTGIIDNSSGSLNDMVADFINANAEWVVYLRKDPRFLCPDHWDATRSTKLDYDLTFCPKCWGTGVKATAQIVPSRIILGKAQLSIRNTDARLEPGYIEYNTANIDLPNNILPKIEDFVFHVEWNKPSQQITSYPVARPINLINLYMLKVVNVQYSDQVAFMSCGAEKSNYLTNWANTVLPYMYNLAVLPAAGSSANYW